MNPLAEIDPAVLDNMRSSAKRENDLRRGRVDPNAVTRANEPPPQAQEELLEADVSQDIASRFNALLDAFQALAHRVERLEAKSRAGEFVEDAEPAPKPQSKSKPKKERT